LAWKEIILAALIFSKQKITFLSTIYPKVAIARFGYIIFDSNRNPHHE